MRLCRIFPIITCLLTLTACGSKGANEIVTEDSSEEASQTVVKNEENDTMPDYSSYENIIEGIRKGMEDPLTFCTQNEVLGGSERLYYAMTATNCSLGYLQEDIDGDGIEELLIASGDSEGNVSDGDLIYMFTIRNGKSDCVIAATERDCYQLYENGIIEYVYTYPNQFWGSDYCRYENGKLNLIAGLYRTFDTEGHIICYYKDSRGDDSELIEEESNKISDELEARYIKKQTIQLHLF